MLSSDVVIEYCGEEYRLPVLLVGSARSKLTDRRLSDELEEAMEGLRPVVVLEGAGAEAFHVAAHKISVSLERGKPRLGSACWPELDASAPRERSTYGSQILGKLQLRIRTARRCRRARRRGAPRGRCALDAAEPHRLTAEKERRAAHMGGASVLEEPGLVGEHDRLDAVAEVELLEDVRDVRLDGRVADEELLRRSRRSRGRAAIRRKTSSSRAVSSSSSFGRRRARQCA